MKNTNSESKHNVFILQDNQKTKICNFANNYYGDQQCYVIEKSPKQTAFQMFNFLR